MRVRNFPPLYYAFVAIIAAIIVVASVAMLFPFGDTNQKAGREVINMGAESIEATSTIISEEARRLLSERPAGTQDAVISEETKRSLTTRPPGAVDAVITPEVARSLSERPNN